MRNQPLGDLLLSFEGTARPAYYQRELTSKPAIVPGHFYEPAMHSSPASPSPTHRVLVSRVSLLQTRPRLLRPFGSSERPTWGVVRPGPDKLVWTLLERPHPVTTG